MQHKYLPEEFIRKYINGTCNDEEKAIVESWHVDDLSCSSFVPSKQRITQVYDQGRKAIVAYSTVPVKKMWPRIAAAASIVICLGIGTYILSSKYVPSISSESKLADIAPGGNRAFLTLADGHRIALDSIHNGTLAFQGNTSIKKTEDGSVTYQSAIAGQDNNSTEVEYNALSTPVGGQYHLILTDGTKVWLNAASSIKFPTNFLTKERKVEVTGEVYFEVAHNPSKPFRVVSPSQIVEVLGTHFNIKAYPDESHIKTTLLEGAVKVSAGKNSIAIRPGQQSVVGDNRLSIVQADVEEAVAWKNGYFKFKDEKIESVLRKLSRWYNIDVQYQGKVSKEGFNGAVSRSKNLGQVLHILEKTEAVHFKLEGRRVTVIQ